MKSSLKEIYAFAEVYGYTVLQGDGRYSHLYSITKTADAPSSPLCPYMLPEHLAIWVDGYRFGLNASVPTQVVE